MFKSLAHHDEGFGILDSGFAWPDEHASDSYAGKSLAERLTGRFYTPDCLSSDLANQMVAAIDRECLRGRRQICDPFCGDGRLVVSLLLALSKDKDLRARSWHIVLADRESSAVAQAVQNVGQLVQDLRLDATIATRVGDTFAAPIEVANDLIITNPPWELLKPDSREIARMSVANVNDYRAKLRLMSDRLDGQFPNARGDGAWGGWGTNLARCGWDFSMRSCRPGGVIGIILPSTLLGDQASRRIREAMFKGCAVADIAAYPSEARLFERVDQPVVALTLVRGSGRGNGRLRLHEADRRMVAHVAIPALAELKERDYSVAVGFGAQAQALTDLLIGHNQLGALEGTRPTDLWMGRELDETRVAEKLVGGLARPFVKGRMVARHMIVETPSQSVRAKLCAGFSSIDKPRAVWRDVSRSSQRRRMIGSVIPPGWVAGNSLHVACFRNGDLQRTKALHGVLSSFVFEFQVRSRLATGHMSLGVVRTARAPQLTARSTARLAEIVDQAMAGVEGAADRLEIAVAKDYGLSRNSMIALIDCFPKIDDAEKARLLAPRHWS